MTSFRVAVLALILGGCATTDRDEPPPLTIDDVLRMAKAGVGSKAIVARIETSGVRAKLTLDDIIGLKQQGLSDEVLAALIRAADGRPERRQRVVVREPWPAYYYYRGPVYAPYWW